MKPAAVAAAAERRAAGAAQISASWCCHAKFCCSAQVQCKGSWGGRSTSHDARPAGGGCARRAADVAPPGDVAAVFVGPHLDQAPLPQSWRDANGVTLSRGSLSA